MANEPSRRIERMLRKWARDRRDAAGPGWPVHPATRRLLQGEVARTLGARGAARAGTDAGRGWFALLWPRLLWGSAGLALIVLVWMALPQLSKQPAEMAAVDGNTPPTVEPMADRAFKVAAEPALPPPNLGPAATSPPTPMLALTPAPTTTPTVSRQEAEVAGERTRRLAMKLEDSTDAAMAGAAKAMKSKVANPAAPSPERLPGVSVPAGGKSQPLPELTKQLEAKVAGETGELLARQNNAQPLPPITTQANELTDQAESRLKNAMKRDAATLSVAPISAPAAATKPMVSQPTIASARTEAAGGATGGSRPSAPAGPAAAGERSLLAGKIPLSGVAPSALFRKESPAAAAAPPAPTAPGGAGGGVAQQSFVRLNAPENYRRNLQSPPSPALLQQFQIQRAGQVVTVVDEDGSVYQGQVIAAETATNRTNRRLHETKRSGDLAPVADKDLEKKVGPPVSQSAFAGADQNSFWFRATGTNRSLNQRVVFTGEFQPRAGSLDAPVADAKAGSETLRSDFVATNSLQTGLPQRSSGATAAGRILGRAQVGANSEIQVEAVSPGSPRR